jgi:hypothetical protein
MKTTDFYTAPRSEAGVEIPLLLPDGTDSGEWLRVYGPDSRAYVRAQTRLHRRLGELGALKDEDAADALALAILTEFRVALVIAWSFEESFTPEAVAEFLKKAPRVADQLTAAAGDVKRFFGPGSPNSTSGPDSSEPSKAATPATSSNDSASRRPRARKSSRTSSATGGSSGAGDSATPSLPLGAD